MPLDDQLFAITLQLNNIKNLFALPPAETALPPGKGGRRSRDCAAPGGREAAEAAESVPMGTKQLEPFCFFCDVHFSWQVLRTLLNYFWRHSWFSTLLCKQNYWWRHHFPHLRNTKTWISLKQKRYSKKENALFLTLLSLSHKQQSLFTSSTLKTMHTIELG